MKAYQFARGNKAAVKHGLYQHELYRTWVGMWQRCTNPNSEDFPNWGGRGIEVCKKWKDFAAFVKDVGPRPDASYSLDRINSDGNYKPGNVRWATASEQRLNQRRMIRNVT